tara:strand:+ start:764 stop:997 length:234 start_codon:yes stop_codon:yes gene_type:complete
MNNSDWLSDLDWELLQYNLYIIDVNGQKIISQIGGLKLQGPFGKKGQRYWSVEGILESKVFSEELKSLIIFNMESFV